MINDRENYVPSYFQEDEEDSAAGLFLHKDVEAKTEGRENGANDDEMKCEGLL